MTIQALIPEVGAPAWVEDLKSHPLPADLINHSSVTLAAVDGLKLRVNNAEGKEWELIHWQVDCGFKVRGSDGVWRHESHPEALDAIERELERYRTQPPPSAAVALIRQDYERRLQWILERNGRMAGD